MELRLCRPNRTDAVLALVLGTLSLVQVLAAPIAPRAVGVVIAVASIAPIAWRRVHPVGAAVVGSLAWLVPSDGYLFLGYVAAFVLFYSLGVYARSGRAAVATVFLGAVVSVVATAQRAESVGELFGGLTFVAAPALVGWFVRRHRDQARRLQELAEHLERERERGAHAAVAEERARIARDLHDAVAHGVSVIAIQSDAAEAALDRDPDLARAPLQTIRGSAAEALGEMRRLLGILREEGEQPELAPRPGLDQLPALVERAEEAGVGVTVQVDGDPRPLPASVDSSAYRIVQEALTNVRKHAAGAQASVTLGWAPRALTLQVADDGAGRSRMPAAGNGNGNGSGHGIVGMGERVRLHGGELRAGPGDAGGWVVTAVLPLDQAP